MRGVVIKRLKENIYKYANLSESDNIICSNECMLGKNAK
jgi:hypothetical protein